MFLRRLSLTSILLLICFMATPLRCAARPSDQGGLRLRSSPEGGAKTVALLSNQSRVEVIQIVAGWAEVSCGKTVGWTEIEHLMEHLAFSKTEKTSTPAFSFSLELPAEGNSLVGLLDFTFGDTEQEKKMNDPNFKHIVHKVSSEWGPLFKYKTPYYSWRGIHLLGFWKEKLRLNLVKGKVNYTDSFGPTWSGELQDRIIESNRGILSNRSLFGRGRNLFLELRYSF